MEQFGDELLHFTDHGAYQRHLFQASKGMVTVQAFAGCL